KSRRWRLHNHYKNYPTKEQAIMNPPRGVKIPDWVLLCDRFASEDFQKISARNKMNRSKNLVPPAVGSKSMARVVHEKMKQGKQVTAIERYEICHYSRKKDGMINETADKILRDLRDEEANSSSTPAEICMAKLGHIPGYLKGRSASGRNILANERLQRELQSEKEKTKKLQMHINKIEKKHNNLKQKVDYLMKHLPRLSGWKSQGQGNEEYAGSDDDDEDAYDGQGNEEYDGFDDDDNGDDAQGNEEYNSSDDDEYGDDGLDGDGEEHEDAI
ncbi:Myb domain protein 62, partial [Tanacetum coccineum]